MGYRLGVSLKQRLGQEEKNITEKFNKEEKSILIRGECAGEGKIRTNYHPKLSMNPTQQWSDHWARIQRKAQNQV